MKRFLTNLINARIDAILSKTPIVQNAIDERVEAALQILEIPSIVRIQADRAIADDCDVCALVQDRVNEIDLSDHIDYSQLAYEIDYDDLQKELNYSSLAECIEYDDLGGEIDYEDLGKYIDCDDLAASLKESISFSITVN